MPWWKHDKTVIDGSVARFIFSKKAEPSVKNGQKRPAIARYMLLI